MTVLLRFPQPQRHPASRMPLLFVAVAALALACVFAAGLFGQPCVTVDPRPGLWPPAEFTPRLHPGAAGSLETIPRPLDQGALRVGADGCYEILLLGGSGDVGYRWERYDSTRWDHYQMASGYQRYGRGASYGHGHGDDGLVAMPYELWPPLFGRDVTQMELLDAQYRPGVRSRWWISDLMQQCAETPSCCGRQPDGRFGPVACAGSQGEPTPTPSPTPRPPAGACDSICQPADATRCPSDCPAPQPTPAPTPALCCDPCRQYAAVPLPKEVVQCAAVPPGLQWTRTRWWAQGRSCAAVVAEWISGLGGSIYKPGTMTTAVPKECVR